eukprot:gnl/MRDRNA2_/MRDRNA2_86300_c0_seq2.p1 gnl/MRDRNA2_/MRDRNA2_86300_c0~~gnl/MRDRNA2_/MRDRNA2_86300_c0_seq2.p1  ORF type:complete len:350 (+),score=40.48 gnl/MRDRNA2_/MRDRNA2_86300_c0_seq2:117-1166(+)
MQYVMSIIVALLSCGLLDQVLVVRGIRERSQDQKCSISPEAEVFRLQSAGMHSSASELKALTPGDCWIQCKPPSDEEIDRSLVDQDVMHQSSPYTSHEYYPPNCKSPVAVSVEVSALSSEEKAQLFEYVKSCMLADPKSYPFWKVDITIEADVPGERDFERIEYFSGSCYPESSPLCVWAQQMLKTQNACRDFFLGPDSSLMFTVDFKEKLGRCYSGREADRGFPDGQPGDCGCNSAKKCFKAIKTASVNTKAGCKEMFEQPSRECGDCCTTFLGMQSSALQKAFLREIHSDIKGVSEIAEQFRRSRCFSMGCLGDSNLTADIDNRIDNIMKQCILLQAQMSWQAFDEG